MEDTPPDPTPSQPKRRNYRLSSEEGSLTPLVQSRRPSRQYFAISPPSNDSFSLVKSYPPRTDNLPAFTDPWPSRPSISSLQSPASPEFWSSPREQAGPSTPRPLTQVRDESPNGKGRERSTSLISEDTIRRLPLTPFPPWMSNSDRESRAKCEERCRQSQDEDKSCRCENDVGLFRKGVVHAVVLAMQFTTFLGVLCVWMSVAALKGVSSDATFWKYLWLYFQPMLGVLCLYSLAMLVVYEVSGLSDTGFLVTQVVVLVAASTTGLCFAWWAFEENGRLVIGTAVGAGAMMLGVGMFGFVRAVVVWWVMGGLS